MDNTLFDLSDNPLLSSKVTVTIKVLDVNEFPPELAFIYETFVCENAKVGQVRMCVWISTCASIWVSGPVVGFCSELMWENCALIFSFHAERELLPVQRCLSVSPYSVFYTRERSSLAYMRKCDTTKPFQNLLKIVNRSTQTLEDELMPFSWGTQLNILQ